MAIVPPSLDDRSYEDLVAELVSRIPAHTPEWTNPVPGDPGRTLLELFAWLTDTLLYRANLIPERQRLAFLRLLGVTLRPAEAARGVVSLSIDEPLARAVMLKPGAKLGGGPVPFETRSEVTVLPVVGTGYCKRPLSESEQRTLAPVVDGLREVYRLDGQATGYVTTPVFPAGAAEPDGFDLVGGSVDHCLWLALLAPTPALKEDTRNALGSTPLGARQLLSVGVVPALSVPALFEEIGPRAAIPHIWEMSSLTAVGDPEYLRLEVIVDGSAGLTRPGVLRLALPPRERIGAPANDVRMRLTAGVGDSPPRLDDPAEAARLVAWLRLRPEQKLNELRLSWAGVNAVEIDQRETITGRLVGQGDGTPDLELRLPAGAVDPASLVLQVEGNQGYETWRAVDDLAFAPIGAPAFVLDDEAGLVRFGDGMRGRIPEPDRRVRVAEMRAGGGAAGNLPPGTLRTVDEARTLDGSAPPKLKATQSVATDGGADGETLAQAERRIPALFRDRDRAVTEEDYRRIAADTRGVRVGRVEVLAQFRPKQRRSGVPGVVSVMVLPYKDGFAAPAPRADRPFLETVHAYLDARRPLATELYVIGCEYVPLGLGVGVSVRDGFGRDAVLQAVRDALRVFLWPLAPGGIAFAGWPLGRAAGEREIEAAVARVPGVAGVNGVTLFERQDQAWRQVVAAERCAPVSLALERWQLPELLTVVVADGDAPTDLRGQPNPFTDGIPVPVVPELC